MEKRLQTYDTDRIVVTFDPNICQHSGVCLRTLPGVFDIKRRRWIMPELAEPEAVAAAIERCPSGALRYQLRLSEAGATPAATAAAATARFTELYAAFNTRDIDKVLAQFAPDVDWPNGMEGGRVIGREAVRAYWTRQWTLVNPTVEPTGVVPDSTGRAVVTVHQVVRALSGDLLKDHYVQHIYEMRDGLIIRMDIRDGETPA